MNADIFFGLFKYYFLQQIHN